MTWQNGGVREVLSIHGRRESPEGVCTWIRAFRARGASQSQPVREMHSPPYAISTYCTIHLGAG